MFENPGRATDPLPPASDAHANSFLLQAYLRKAAAPRSRAQTMT